MSMFRSIVLVVILAGAAFLAAAPAQTTKALDDIDRSVKPGDDFYWYANGGWLKTVAIPPGQTSFDTRAILKERTSERVRSLIQGAEATARDGVAKKVGDYYASFMDQSTIEAKGFKPLAHDMATISDITDRASLSAYLGRTLNTDVDGVVANADHIFAIWINQGFEDS